MTESEQPIAACLFSDLCSLTIALCSLTADHCSLICSFAPSSRREREMLAQDKPSAVLGKAPRNSSSPVGATEFSALPAPSYPLQRAIKSAAHTSRAALHFFTSSLLLVVAVRLVQPVAVPVVIHKGTECIALQRIGLHRVAHRGLHRVQPLGSRRNVHDVKLSRR